MNTVLWDMDGTLLPLSQEDFVRLYFGELTAYAAKLGFEGNAVTSMLWDSVKAMVKNDGTVRNATRFWEVFDRHFPGNEHKRDLFDAFYETTYGRIAAHVTPHPLAAKCVQELKRKGYRTAVATNPFFPESAQRHRLEWAGLDPDDFEWITHYENSRFCKPNPLYYTDVSETLGVSPADCLMIGNDVTEDMEAAAKAGITGWLLTDCLINNDGLPLDRYPHGDFEALYAFICALPSLS